MKPERKRKLQAAGWKVGTVKDFLDLSDADCEYIEAKLALMRAVREQRLKRGITQADLAKRMNTAQSRIAGMENGRPDVAIDSLFRALFALGATRREIAKAM